MPDATPDYLKAYRDVEQELGGEAFDVTLWASPASQEIRFAIFAEMIDLRGQRLLDAGCGRGDFAAYLLKHRVRFDQFIGIDGLLEVINFANQRKLKRCAFHHGDFVKDTTLLTTGQPEVITFSGTLNTMPIELATQLLDAAWQATDKVLAFNFLSSTAGRKAPPQQYPAKRLDTRQLIDFAFERTWHVQFRQDYFRQGHDATIVMAKA